MTSSTDDEGNPVDETTYYVVNIISRDVSEFHDEFVDTMSLSLDTDIVTDYFFNKHKIKFFDQDLYKLMSEEYEVLK